MSRSNGPEDTFDHSSHFGHSGHSVYSGRAGMTGRTRPLVALALLAMTFDVIITFMIESSASEPGAPADGVVQSASPSPTAAPSSVASATSPAAVPESATPTSSGASPDDALDAVVPMPATLPRSGTGATTVLTPPRPDSPARGNGVRYTLEIEGGLGIPADHFAGVAQRVLTDRRGWQTQDTMHFVNVSAAARAGGAKADVRIILASPGYVDRSCLPLRTMGELSCFAGDKVLLNAERWAHGTETYGSDVAQYRIYLVSHEVGHALGHGHRTCPGRGENAPVMVQQTKSLFGCRPWPWPVHSPEQG